MQLQSQSDSSTTIQVGLEIHVCDTFFSRLKGALGKGRIHYEEAYLFPDVSRIHTFFMQDPITVLLFDRMGRIVDFSHELDPYRIFPSGFKSGFAILEAAPNRFRYSKFDLPNSYVRFKSSLARQIGIPSLSVEEI